MTICRFCSPKPTKTTRPKTYNAASSKITLVLIAIDCLIGEIFVFKNANASDKDPQGNYYRLSIAGELPILSSYVKKVG